MIASKQPLNGCILNQDIIGHERAILSCLMNDKRACERLGYLSSEDFSSPPHREIFSAIFDVFIAQQEPNLLAVTDRLREKGRLAAVGGPSEITSISLETTSEAIVDYSLDCMREASRKRRAAKVGEQLKDGQISPEEAQE